MEELFTIKEARAWAEKEMPRFIAQNKDVSPQILDYPNFRQEDYENGGKFQVKDLIFYILPYVEVAESCRKNPRKTNFISFCDGKLLVCGSRTTLIPKINCRI